jgi:hypothetical protein
MLKKILALAIISSSIASCAWFSNSDVKNDPTVGSKDSSDMLFGQSASAPVVYHQSSSAPVLNTSQPVHSEALPDNNSDSYAK